MFDLFRSRDKAMRYVLGTLLGLVALSLVVTLIPGFGMPGSAPEQVVAEIGDQQLTLREVQNTIQGALRGREIPPQMVQMYVPQMVDRMIAERAIAYQAERLGFKITDEELASAIRSMLAQYFPNGNPTQQEYQRFLQGQNLTVSEFERNVRANLLLLRLQNIAMEGAVVSPAEIETEYRRRNDKIKVEYVKWTPPADLRSQAVVTPEEMQMYYNSQKAQFTTEEKRSFTVLIADEAKIGATIQQPEAELRASYNQNLDRFRTPERARTRHILIKTTDKSPAEQAAAQKKAKDLLEQLRKGADFAELAKKNSEDPGSAAKGGDLDWVTRGQMVPPFEKAVFSLPVKQISDLVTTEYGLHIVQVLEREQARVKPFEEVRDQLASDNRREAVFNRMQQVIEQARAELARNPGNADQVASRLGLSVYKVDKAGRGTSIPEIGTSADLEANVAGLRAGEVSQVVQVGPSKLAVAAVTQVFPARPSEFAEVQDQIRETLISQKTAQAGDMRRKQVTDALKAAGGNMQAAAKVAGSEIKSTDFFNVEGAAEGIGSASHLAEGFRKGTGTVVGPFTVGTDVFLARVVEKQNADPGKLASERESLMLAVKRQRAAERKELFEDGLVAQLVREGKVKKYQENIARLMQNFRG
ncbi:MAG TPA: peptidylprolyl isomerase [Bryobacteraceae bacterium]|nr:peptidylprolyl isomerase [Bryobacteraceae bacterium]